MKLLTISSFFLFFKVYLQQKEANGLSVSGCLCKISGSDADIFHKCSEKCAGAEYFKGRDAVDNKPYECLCYYNILAGDCNNKLLSMSSKCKEGSGFVSANTDKKQEGCDGPC